ncbi:hypothetical protein [Actinomadura alba]|uniref:Copper(I)-binding protein n=1 Tax=Actinomadura alba TaxID=406431 RepID=A0ABR7LLF2_9ACTN|nr:hypothetical protein [Actinomadura alba]MBC6465596.1 hypothetical protein [Actinomadura alba]
MSRNNRRVAALAIAGALTLAPAVSGCGAGHNPQTAQPVNLTEGVNVSTDSGVNVRNLFVLGPAPGRRLTPGASAPVYAAVINDTTDGQPDRLVAVGSPDFQQPAPLTGGGIDLPARQLVQLGAQAPGQPGTAIVLGGLGKELLGGESIELTLRFQRSGDLKVLVPVVPHADAYATYSPAAPPAPTPNRTAPASPGTPGEPASSTVPAGGSPTEPTPSGDTGGGSSPDPVTHG